MLNTRPMRKPFIGGELSTIAFRREAPAAAAVVRTISTLTLNLVETSYKT